ncbi:adenylate/guanylate cyclase domain-containing protein [Piscinibacter terrae]|nr:FlgO family outer membrane protein [Albitalea terrae]
MSTPIKEELWYGMRRETRTLVVVDVVESVRLMEANEADVIDRWRRFVNEVQTQVLPRHSGRLVKSLGDGLLLEFERVPSAVSAAIELQSRIAPYNLGRDGTTAMYLRIGAHEADVIIDDLDVYGAGVNLAARLATLAQAGEIIVSPRARDKLADDLDADIEDIGERYVKHIAEPVRAFRVRAPTMGTSATSRAPIEDLSSAIAVIPFAARQSTEDTAVLGEVIADEVICSLSRASELRVISRLSSSRVQHLSTDLDALRQQLRVAYLLTGAFQVSADKVRITLELSDTVTRTVVWAEAFSASLRALLAGEDPVIERIVSGTGHSIIACELHRVSSAAPQTLQGYSLLLGAIALMHRASATEFERSRTILEHLAERHGRVSQAYAWLAKWYVMRTVQGWSLDRAADGVQALALANRALDIAPDNSLALATRGHVQGFMHRDFDAAARSLRQAIDCNPSESLAWLYTGTLEAWKSNGTAAMEAASKALALSPLDPLRDHYYSHAGFAALTSGHYEQAIEWSLTSLKANRLHTPTHRTLVVANWLSGRQDKAREHAQELMRLEPSLTVKAYLERFPGGPSDYALMSAEALRAAGVPAGH